MPTSSILLIGLGFVAGILFSFIFRIRLNVGTDLNQLINKRAYELITKTLHQFDPIIKEEETSGENDE